jgi:hypothetical protein
MNPNIVALNRNIVLNVVMSAKYIMLLVNDLREFLVPEDIGDHMVPQVH